MKELFEKFGQMIAREDFDDILVVCHENPDGDAVGSAWGLSHALRLLGKRSSAYCSDELPKKFSYIASEVPEFDYKHVISVDVASPQMMEKLISKGVRPDCVIDHHRGNSLDCDFKIVFPERAACGEIVFELAKFLGVKPDLYFADCIYTAISTDTGCFKYSNVTSETFEIASELFGYTNGRGFSRINKEIFDTNSMRKLRIESECIKRTELFEDGNAAFCAVTLAMKKEFETLPDETDNIINIVRTIEGVRVAFVAKEKTEGVYKVSVRSDIDYVDASEFCKAFGGGGHRAAAGCSIEGDPEKVKTLIEARLSEMVR